MYNITIQMDRNRWRLQSENFSYEREIEYWEGFNGQKS